MPYIRRDEFFTRIQDRVNVILNKGDMLIESFRARSRRPSSFDDDRCSLVVFIELKYVDVTDIFAPRSDLI